MWWWWCGWAPGCWRVSGAMGTQVCPKPHGGIGWESQIPRDPGEQQGASASDTMLSGYTTQRKQGSSECQHSHHDLCRKWQQGDDSALSATEVKGNERHRQVCENFKSIPDRFCSLGQVASPFYFTFFQFTVKFSCWCRVLRILTHMWIHEATSTIRSRDDDLTT